MFSSPCQHTETANIRQMKAFHYRYICVHTQCEFSDWINNNSVWPNIQEQIIYYHSKCQMLIVNLNRNSITLTWFMPSGTESQPQSMKICNNADIFERVRACRWLFRCSHSNHLMRITYHGLYSVVGFDWTMRNWSEKISIKSVSWISAGKLCSICYCTRCWNSKMASVCCQ